MPYQIIIYEIDKPISDTSIGAGAKIFEQTVETLNLKAVINTINATPRKPRTPKVKA